ncbi:MAG: hypothetical protein R2882_06845 [Gemmatimonadales bacterium]
MGAHRRPQGRCEHPAAGYSDDIGRPAVQGPKTESLLQPIASIGLDAIGYYHHATGRPAGWTASSRGPATPARTASSSTVAKTTVALWEAITKLGVQPIGLGVDRSGLEMGYALYGQEIDDTITLLEAGLAWIVKLDKGSPFVGSTRPAPRRNGGDPEAGRLHAQGAGIARHGYPTWIDGRSVDPSERRPEPAATPDRTTFLPASAVHRDGVRGRAAGERIPAEVVKRPFWAHGSVKK